MEYLQRPNNRNIDNRNIVEYYPRQQSLPVEPVRIIIIQQPDTKSDDNIMFYIIIILGVFLLWKNLPFNGTDSRVNTSKTVDVPYTVNWSPNVNTSNDVPYTVNWSPKMTPISIHGTPSKLRLGGRYIPQDVVNLAFKYTNNRNQALFLLAMCYHERGIKSWNDNFLCGYGATDTKWYSRYAGWEKQLSYASSNVRRYFRFRLVSNQTSQRFAKDSYKTTHWWNYANVWDYYNTLMRQY